MTDRKRDPLPGPKPISLSDGFWERVLVGSADDCWLWQGSVRNNGYGQLQRRAICKIPLKAHRVAWELTNGSIPDGVYVLHRCDNRRCCNPSHLFLGTGLDNINDMVSKGRSRKDSASGRFLKLVHA